MIEVFRLGSNVDSPLKVVLSNSAAMAKIFKNKHQLDKSEHKGVSIKNDLTSMQRRELAELRKRLEERTEQGERDLVIRYINFEPKIVKKSNKRGRDEESSPRPEKGLKNSKFR